MGKTGSASRATQPRKKPGYQLPEALVLAVKEAVERGAAESQNAFVERALVRELRETRRRHLESAYAEAAADPEFLEDMRSIIEAYDCAAGDGLRGAER
ncbi:MAG: hypothetical protein ABR559_07630 [Gemmatimonadota bacterium]